MLDRWKLYCGVIPVDASLDIVTNDSSVTHAKHYNLCFKNQSLGVFKLDGEWHYAILGNTLHSAEYVWEWVLDGDQLHCPSLGISADVHKVDETSFEDDLHPLPYERRMEWLQSKQNSINGARV